MKYQRKLYGFVHTIYDSNPSYIEPVNEIFKFSKVYAGMEWREEDGRHTLEAWKDEKLILKFEGSPNFIPKSIPHSKPRSGWLMKDNENYILNMRISELKSRLAFTSIHIPEDSLIADVAKSLRPIVKYSVFYRDAGIEMSLPSKVPIMKLMQHNTERHNISFINS